jgi:hypothetical protein
MIRKMKVIDIVLISVVLLVLISSAPFLWHALERWIVGFHHRAVAAELASWESEYGVVHNDKEAWRAAQMVGYIERYYVPAPGYESDSATENALEDQRERTLKAIVKALREYTGKDYGMDGKKWEEWAQNEKAKISAMEIYDNFKKEYSSAETYSLEELKSYYTRAANELTCLVYMNDRWKVHSVVWLDEKNSMHYRPFILEGWIDVDTIRTLEEKIKEDRPFVERQLIVVLVLDPNSMPSAAARLIEALLNNPDVKLTLMFGRRTGEDPQISKK